METITKVINSDKYVFNCNVWQTSRNWGHEAILTKNGVIIAKDKITYYNRTWEAYQYQSICKNICSNLINEQKQIIVNNYKHDNNIKRLSKESKENLFNDNLNLRYLISLKDSL